MVHILPMNWTDYTPGQDVAVWVYANVAAVELFLNGKSLGAKSFDQKVTTFGRKYLETTEPTGDDYNYPSGSYTSPNGSTGKLHLTWSVPFQPGRLTAVATQNGRVVARDEIHTAGEPRALTLTPDTQEIAADGKSLSFLTVEVTDHDSVVVPDASNLIKFRVEGPGTLAGVDNGQQENAQSYQAPSVPAFNGKALVVVRSTRQAGHITVTASSPGLGRASATLRSVAAGDRGAAVISSVSAGAAAGAPAALTADAASPATPMADASYSGAPDTLPAAMLDGDLTTGWSNYYNKSGTANLHAVSVSHASEWVSVSWPDRQEFSAITVFFTLSSTLSLPASISVTYWDGHDFVPVKNLQIVMATASNQPTTLTFDRVHTGQVRLTMTSPTPGTGTGFLRIAELQVLSNGTNIA